MNMATAVSAASANDATPRDKQPYDTDRFIVDQLQVGDE